MLRPIRAFFAPSEKVDLEDYNLFENKILELQNKVEALEKSLSESENRLNAKIDRIQPVIYNISNKET